MHGHDGNTIMYAVVSCAGPPREGGGGGGGEGAGGAADPGARR